MTPEKVQELAEHSGLGWYPGWVHDGYGKKNLEKFAALVEQHTLAKERRTFAMIVSDWLKGI